MAGKVYKQYNISGQTIVLDDSWAKDETKAALKKICDAVDALESAKFAMEHIANVTGIDEEASIEINNAVAKIGFAMADAIAIEDYFSDREQGKIDEAGNPVDPPL